MVRTRVRKRKFQGNQHTTDTKRKKSVEKSPQVLSEQDDNHNVNDGEGGSNTPTVQSASARKIGAVNPPEIPYTDEHNVSGYRLVDMRLLGSVFTMLPCKECHAFELTLVEDNSKRMGSASCLLLSCNSCGWSEVFYTSEKSRHCFTVNRRMVYAMRSIGCGKSAMSRFCSIMNMPPPVGTKPFQRHTRAILRAVKDVANSTMKDVASEIHQKKKNGEVVKTGISCDGTWQRRGFSSLHGCVTAISMDTGKILDVEPLSKVCKQCKMHDNEESLLKS